MLVMAKPQLNKVMAMAKGNGVWDINILRSHGGRYNRMIKLGI